MKNDLRSLSAAEYVFLRWLQDTHPRLYAEAETRQKGIGGFLDSFTQVIESIQKSAPDLMNQYMKGKQDLALLKENLARAKQGDMPIQAPGIVYQPPANALASVPWWAWGLMGVGVLVLVSRR